MGQNSFGNFTTDDNAPVELCGGTVLSYSPSTEMYKVAIDGLGSVDSVRSMKFGANKPYRKDKRVLCFRVRTLFWTIIGQVPEYEHPEPAPNSPTDTIVEKDKKARGAVGDKRQILAATAKKVGEEIHFEGDSVLDNDKGSFVKILESGDIWGLASYFCLFLFSAVKNLIFLKARDFILDLAGLFVQVENDISVKRATVKADVTSDQSDEKAEPDMALRAGYLGGQNLFKQEAEVAPSALAELTLPTANIAGGVGVVSTLDVESESVSDTVAASTGSVTATKDDRVLWGLLGDHTLLEVDNASKEVRLSRVDVQKDATTNVISNTETEIKQLRFNDRELALQWKDRWISVNDSRASISYGDNYFSVDDKKASLVFGENFIIVNENGVQIKGFLELVGGKIRLVGDEQAEGVKPEIGGVAAGAVANMDFGNNLLDLTMSMTVNRLALVNQNFFTKYDTDQGLVAVHPHNIIVPTPGTPVTPPLTLADVGKSAAQKATLSTKAS